MSLKLFIEAILKITIGIIIVGLLLFIPGTFSYWQGWLFMSMLFLPMFIAGVVMMIFNPDLLRRRLKSKETEKEQKVVVFTSGIMFALGFVLAGLNNRFEWFVLPCIITWISSVLFVFAYILYAVVLKENAYLLRTIEVEKNQKLVDTGLYKVVRHPMYATTIILFLSMPLMLGSLISFFVFLIYPFVIIKRIKNEEEVLEKNLEGYIEYEKKVKYRLVPYIW